MRRLVLLGAVVSAALAASVTAAGGAGPGLVGPIGADIVEEGRAPFHNGGPMPVKAGKDVLVQKFTIAPGQTTGWQTHPNAAFLVASGMLSHYTSCADKEMWHGGSSHLHAASSGPEVGLLKNEGSEPAQLIAIFSDAASGQPAGTPGFVPAEGPAGCDLGSGAAPEITELGRGTAYGSAVYEVEEGKSVVIQHFTVEPGWASGWHRHPDTTLVIQLKGELVNYTSCDEIEQWTPGNTYLHLNSEHHDGHANFTKNETGEPAELLAVLFNVPKDHPTGITPLTFTPPPGECPTVH